MGGHTASRDGALGIWKARSDGSSPTRLATVDTVQSLVVLTRRSNRLFHLVDGGTTVHLHMPITGGQPKLVTERLAGAVVSPDGRMLAGVYRANDRDQISIGVIDAATGKPMHVFKNAVLGGNTTFGWTRDSRTVLYTTAERINLWAQPLDGGSPRQLTNYTDQWILRFAIFPDGKQMVLSRGTGLRRRRPGQELPLTGGEGVTRTRSGRSSVSAGRRATAATNADARAAELSYGLSPDLLHHAADCGHEVVIHHRADEHSIAVEFVSTSCIACLGGDNDPRHCPPLGDDPQERAFESCHAHTTTSGARSRRSTPGAATST